MKKTYNLIVIFCFLACAPAFSQEAGQAADEQNICTQNLRRARALYDEGKLNEIPQILNSCLQSGFTAEERVEAYRFLAITHLYLNEPGKADDAMLKLLRENPEYRVNEDLDPAEYISLYNSFRTAWLFRAGIKIGMVNSLPYVSEFRGTSHPGSYNRAAGFEFGGFAEFSVNDRLFIQPEIQYTVLNYNYENGQFSQSHNNEGGEVASVGRYEFNRALNYAELFIAAKYQVWPAQPKGRNSHLSDGFVKAFATGGLGIGYLLNAEQNETETQLPGIAQETPGFSLTDPEIDLFHKTNPQAVVGGGTEFKFGRTYVTMELRYGYSFGELVNAENRYKLANTTRGLAADSNHKLHRFSITLGLMQAFYQPKKMIE